MKSNLYSQIKLGAKEGKWMPLEKEVKKGIKKSKVKWKEERESSKSRP